MEQNITEVQSKPIAVYGRVSSSNQENEGTIETQLSAVYDFAEKNKLTIVKKYVDEGWSGDTIIRPALDQLRTDASKKIWQGVLLYDPDRLARRYSYQELITDELREKGIEVLYVTTPAPQNGIEKILFGVQGLFAEYERAKITERFRIGKVRKAKEGNIIVSEAPYGYTYIPKQGTKGDENFRHGYYEINPPEAELVKMIFYWVGIEKVSINEVVTRLTKMGVKPRKNKLGIWSKSTIGNMLRNTTYIGEGRYGSTYGVAPVKPLKTQQYRKNKKTSRRIKPHEEWIIIPTPAIIEKNVFDQVAVQLRENYLNSHRNRKNEYLLSGKIYCPCGERRAGEGTKKTNHFYYRCTDRIHRFPLPKICKEGGVNATNADNCVWDKLMEILSSKELILAQLRAWEEHKVNGPEQTVDFRKSIEGEIIKLQEQENRFVRAYGEGLINIEQFKNFLGPIKMQLKEKRSQLEKSNVIKEPLVILPTETEIDTFVNVVREKMQKPLYAEKKKLVESIINRVVGSPDLLSVYGSIPVNYFTNVELQTSDRYRQDAIRQNSESVFPFTINIKLKTTNHTNIIE